MDKSKKTGVPYVLRILGVTLYPFIWGNVLLLATLAVSGVFVARLVGLQIEQEFAWNVAAEVARRLPPITELQLDPPRLGVLGELAISNPELEPYVVDLEGRILFPSAKLPRSRIALEPIRAATADAIAPPPLFGDDPRDPAGQVLFVASPLLEPAQGYLYLVLRSRFLASTQTLNDKFRFGWTLFLRFLPPFFACLLLGIGFTLYVTRRFRKIASLIHSYSLGGSPLKWESGTNDNISQTAKMIEDVASRADEQFRLAQSRHEDRKALLLDIVHDVRGPLTGMHAAAESLSNDVIVNRGSLSADLLSALRTGATTLRALSTALQSASESELPQTTVRRQVLPVASLVEAVLSQMRPMAEKSGIRLFAEFDDRASVFADRDLLQRILLNLVDNALRHTPTGGVVYLRANRASDATSFEVSDTGVGIPESEIARIFDPFFRGREQSLSEGAGVGLSTVRRFLEMHGSMITVESRIGHGSTFRFAIEDEKISVPTPAPVHPSKDGEEIGVQMRSSYIRRHSKFLIFALPPLIAAILLNLFVPPSSTPASVVCLYLISLWTGALASRSMAMAGAIFAALAFWCLQMRLFYIPTATLVSGFLFGMGFFKFLRTSRGSRASNRAAFLGLVINIAGIVWAIHVFHATVEEELERHSKGAEMTYAETVSKQLSSTICRVTGGPDAESSENRRALLALQVLNTKQSIYLSTPDGLPAPGAESCRIKYCPAVFGGDLGPAPESFFARVMTDPRIPYFVRIPLLECRAKVVCTIVFQSAFFLETYQKFINQFDVLFCLLPMLLVCLPLLLYFGYVPFSFDSIVSAVQNAISRLEEEGRFQELHSKANPLAQPLLDDIYRLITRFRRSKSEAEKADRELSDLARLAAREYGSFTRLVAGRIDRLFQFLKQATSDTDENEASRIVKNLEDVIESQLLLTRALFFVAKPEEAGKPPSSKCATLDLAEIVEDCVIESVGLSDLYGIRLELHGGDASVRNPPESVRLMLHCVVHGLMLASQKNSPIKLSCTQSEEASRLSASFMISAAYEELIFSRDLGVASHLLEQEFLPLLIAGELGKKLGAESKCVQIEGKRVNWELQFSSYRGTAE